MEKLQLKLMGSFWLGTADGKTIDIASKKSRALIALLACAENGERSRSWLQNILWCRGSSQDSLRKELSNLRSIFNQYKVDIFPRDVPRDVVRLKSESLEVDIHNENAVFNGQFLEGLDLPHENNFEDWLRDSRAHYDAKKQQADKIRESKPENYGIVSNKSEMQWLDTPARFCIGLSPVQWDVQVDTQEFRSAIFDDILDRIGRLLLCSGGIDLVDHRYATAVPNMISATANTNPQAQLVLKAMESSGSIVLTLQVILVENLQVICSHRTEIDLDRPDLLRSDSLYVMEYVAETSNEILYTLSRSQIPLIKECNGTVQLVHEAVESMFDLTYAGLDKAALNLKLASELQQDTVIYAWRAFLTCQLVDDPRITDFDQVRDEAEYYAARAMELDRYNPLTLSLLTHVNSFTLRDFGTAAELMSQAKSLCSDHIMTYDADSLLNLYLGDLKQSRKPAMEAARLGRFLPFRYIFMTSLCMIDGLEGKHDSAIAAGEQSLRMHPRKAERPYPPTIRYLAQNYARVGKEDKADELISLLKQADENASKIQLGSNQRAVPTLEIADFLKIGRKSL